jgi:hypothetical protein
MVRIISAPNPHPHPFLRIWYAIIQIRLSSSVSKDMVCNYSNPTDMDADTDIVHVDI